MIPEFLDRHLKHTVIVQQIAGRDLTGSPAYVSAGRTPCLVNESFGRQFFLTDKTAVRSYTYEITLSRHTPAVPTVDMTLEDARDAQDAQIFSKAKVEAVFVYRDPDVGLLGYLLRVRAADTESDVEVLP